MRSGERGYKRFGVPRTVGENKEPFIRECKGPTEV